MPPEVRKESGLKVFQLIQLSLQSGPLSGAKPGYFKRCGSDVARVVVAYLKEVIPQNEVLQAEKVLGFSEKQMDVMQKWKTNAEKAVLNDKAPSKSVLKKQQLKAAQLKKGKK
ncbi:MAG: hypothetical protein SGARI_007037, partial [Bacillariaceae sp.]